MTARPARSCSPWLLPDDGIIDPIAVHIAATGTRRVAMTWPERKTAAARILARGGTPCQVAKRLHIASRDAHALADAITADTTPRPAAPATEGQCPATGVGTAA